MTAVVSAGTRRDGSGISGANTVRGDCSTDLGSTRGWERLVEGQNPPDSSSTLIAMHLTCYPSHYAIQSNCARPLSSFRPNPAQSFAFGVLSWPALAPCSPAAVAASHTARISRRACTMRCLNLAVEVAEHDCLDSIPNLTRYGPARSTTSVSRTSSGRDVRVG